MAGTVPPFGRHYEVTIQSMATTDHGRPIVRAMTWNIHGGVRPDGVHDLRRVVALVQRHAPDIVALQEIDSRRKTPGIEPAFVFLADQLGRHTADAKLITAPDGHYGHAVFSRWPMSGASLHDISLPRCEPRAAIECTIDTPFKPLHVVAAHLGLRFRERRRQADALMSLAQAGVEPTLMLGDFNDWIWRGSVQRALAGVLPARTHHKTFPGRLPLFALDRIYARPAGILLHSWTDSSACAVSDHLPVVADLDLSVQSLAIA
jgi:endonuclease/exonuclease/phosphatase family metal-dependent hydrolase